MRFCDCGHIMIYEVRNTMIFRCEKCGIEVNARPEDVLINGGFKKSTTLTATAFHANLAKKGSALIEKNLILLSRDPSCIRVDSKCKCGLKYNSLIAKIGEPSYIVCPECEHYEIYN